MRFIVNLPKEELESVERICFQVEEAQWFYEDFIRPLDPNLPSLNLRQFCLLIFQHCPLLSGFSPYHHATAFSEFLAYKTRVPVRGAIMLNEAMDEVVLVKGWKKGANWSFPRGKINKDEKDLDCAVREVYEETGFDIQGAGLVGKEEDSKYIEVTMREQHMRLYVFKNVPMDTYFEPRTRKEISKIQWYKLSELPTLKKSKQQQQEGRGEDLAVNANKFYMVAPFLVPLKKWISQQKKQDHVRNSEPSEPVPIISAEVELIEELQPASISPQTSPEDNMSRLLANLRKQGSKSSVSELPEVSEPVQATRDASLQLKELLQVPVDARDVRLDVNTLEDSRITPDTMAQANAMLSTLRTDGTLGGDYLLPHDKPQTTFSQVMGAPQMPKIAQHYMIDPQQTIRRSPTPAFPFSPDQVGRFVAQQPSRLSADRSSPVPSATQYPSAFYSHARQASTMPPYHSQQSAYLSAQSARQAPAPYQRTGDPYFAQAPRFSTDYYPSIPPASKLPPPKLTSHTSTLLAIFKSGSSAFAEAKSAKNTILQGDISKIADQPHLTTSSSTKPYLHSDFPLGESQIEGPPKSLHTKLNRAPVMRTQQQSALLNLFRTPSISNSDIPHKTPTTLEPPLAPIELSAFPSPSHSRVTSEINQAEVKNISKPMSNGKVAIKKRPEITTAKSAKAPVSATVTGPLNVPQFDKIAKKSSNDTSATSATREQDDSIEPQNITPFKILSRTGAPHNPPQVAKTIKQPSPKVPVPSPTSVMPSTKSRSHKRDSPKIFQPQILRRPAQEQSTSHATPQPSLQAQPIPSKSPQPSSPLQSTSKAPPPLSLHVHPPFPKPSQFSPSTDSVLQSPSQPSSPPQLITKDNIMLDRRASQTQDHKISLLSLFNKTTPLPSSKTPLRSEFGSPLAEKFSLLETGISSPREGTRSRIGSGHSVREDGAAGGNGSVARVPIKAGGVDKGVLLSYLDGVVREGRK